MTEHEGIEDVADIFEGQRPLRTVKRIQFSPAADVQAVGAGNNQQAHYQTKRELPCGYLERLREGCAGKEEQRRTDERSCNDHWMQTGKTAFEKAPG